MSISCFDLFKIGIGPSSSHTVGPMKAALQFLSGLDRIDQVDAVEVHLFGSLGATGKGHGSDTALILGLQGCEPATVPVDQVPQILAAVTETGQLSLLGTHAVRFVPDEHIVMSHKQLPGHPNAMRFCARHCGSVISEKVYFSVGGGFVIEEGQSEVLTAGAVDVDFEFNSADELLLHCKDQETSISDIMMRNELCFNQQDVIDNKLDEIWACMSACIERGCQTEGVLPGVLKVKRRAASLYKHLSESAEFSHADPLIGIDWINCYALAVNEENAAGGRVVTAPTNGAAGIIPAVMRYFERSQRRVKEDWHRRFLLVAAAIGILYKKNASISGADVGCQGEVGVACSMAAGALAELMGGTPQQVENAAEIGMEHNLGLTCDPVGGLVQVPCIERNAMASVKAVNAARMALRGDGSHYVSLDKVIKTMRDTGADMKKKYKETARGGLAVNVIEC